MNSGLTDDGEAIDFQYSFPFLYFGDPSINKAVRSFEGIIKHEANAPNFNVNFTYWYGTGNETSGALTSALTLSANVSLYRTSFFRVGYYRASGNTRFQNNNILGRGKQIAIDISHSMASASIEIPYFIVGVKPENRKIR